MTARIIRIRSDALRVPLWSLWFPFVLFEIFCLALWHRPGRLLEAGFWENALCMFIIGLDGWKD